MRWGGGRRSGNVEDGRGGGGGMPLRLGGLGGAGVLVLFVVAALFGVNPNDILNGTAGLEPTDSSTSGPPSGAADPDAQLKDFVSVVLADTEDTWTDIFQKSGKTYVDPKLHLYSGQVSSACGFATAAVGPFYCPGDQRVYLDLDFFRELSDRFAAPGEFAEAYVIAHEIGHHVQTLLGITDKVDAEREHLSSKGVNALSVKTELQADCFAGIWANRAQASKNITIEPGDIDAALGAAAAVGDDRLEREATGTVMPDSFTHGSSEQRMRWFKRGFTAGRIADCDTFNAAAL